MDAEELYSRWTTLADEDSECAMAAAHALVAAAPGEARSWDTVASGLWGRLVSEDECAKPELAGDVTFWEMIHAFRRVIELDPGDSSAAWNMGLALRAACLHGEAHDSFMIAARIDSGEAGKPGDHWRDEDTVWIDYYQAAVSAAACGDWQKSLFAGNLALESGGDGDADLTELLAVVRAHLGPQAPADSWAE